MMLGKKDFIALGFLLVVGVCLYFPILNNVFLSDDYDSLYRICVENTIIVKEFLRPLIDISFKFNYALGGFNSFGYYVFNLTIHIANAFLIYKIANAFKPQEKEYDLYGLFSAFLFLIYPFHNEGIVWLTGRLSSISCFLALLCIYIWLGDYKVRVKTILSIGFYFIGLLAYESILLLPLIIFILIWSKTFSKKNVFLFGSISSMAIIGYLLLRFYASGNVYGEYGARMTDFNLHNIFIKAAKTSGRFFLPPSENSTLLILSFIVIVIAILFLNFRLYKIYGANSLVSYIKLLLVLMISSIIPLLFGISTRTSESDRLLYFPSVFLSMIIAMIILLMMKTLSGRFVVLGALSIYFITCLSLNNENWEKASFLSHKILKLTTEAKNKNVVFINLPDEIEGAFVFRNGFNKALILHNVDTGKVLVNNMLTRLEYLQLKDTIQPINKNDTIILPPVTKISLLSGDSIQVENISNLSKRIFHKVGTTIFYWNKSDMVSLF